MTLPFQFNTESGPSLQPVYRRLSQSISDAIAGGQLESGAALPPSRDLARELGVSRDTILRAYEELAALNLITTSATRGTFVCAPAARRQERDQVRKLNLDRLSSRGRYFQKELSRGPIFIDFAELNFSASPADLLPARRWREITQKLSLPENFDYLAKPQDVLGRPELREALANFLNRSKAMGCDGEDVAVFSVSLHAMSVVCDLLLDAGDTIAIETPCYSGIREVARSHGLNIFPVPVDKEGLIVSRLQQCEERIKLVYVTPAHQDPTGVTMSLARRKELLAWAKRNDAWIIEDDFDGWFHYGSPPPPSLRAMDEDDRVIYVANFWQLLYPLTTLSYCLPPANLMPLLREAKKHSEAFTEPMAQLALANLLNDNYLDKHLRKTKAIFADRRRNLIYALKSSLAEKVQIAGMTAGMHLLVRFPEHDAEQVEAAARQVGLQIMPTKRLYLEQHESSDHRPLFDQGRTREFIVSFAMTESESASIKCQAFAASLKAQSTPEAMEFSTINNETATDAWDDMHSAQTNMQFHPVQLGLRGSSG